MQSATKAEPSSVMSDSCCQTAHPGENHNTVEKWLWKSDRKAFVWSTDKIEDKQELKSTFDKGVLGFNVIT